MDDHHYFMQPRDSGASTGSPNPAGSQKRPVVLGVVNTLGMKCTNQKRKRRWDQPPEEIADCKKVCVSEIECSDSLNIVESDNNSDICVDVNSLINVNNDDVLIESDSISSLCKESDSSELNELVERTLETVNSSVIEENIVNESTSVDIALCSNLSDAHPESTNNNLDDASESVDNTTYVSSMSDSLKQIQYYDEEDSNSEDSEKSEKVNKADLSLSTHTERCNSSEIIVNVASDSSINTVETTQSRNNDVASIDVTVITESSENFNKKNDDKTELPANTNESIDLVQVINDESNISQSVRGLDSADNPVTLRQSPVVNVCQNVNVSVAGESESLQNKIDVTSDNDTSEAEYEKDSSVMGEPVIQRVQQELLLQSDTNVSAKLKDVLKTTEPNCNLEMEPPTVDELSNREGGSAVQTILRSKEEQFSKKDVLTMEDEFTFDNDSSGVIDLEQDQSSVTEDNVKLVEKSQAKYETDIKKMTLSEDVVSKETSSNESWKTVVTFDEDKIVNESGINLDETSPLMKAVACEVKEDSNDKLEYLSPTSGSELQSDDQMPEIPSDEPVEPLVEINPLLESVKEVVCDEVTNEIEQLDESASADKIASDKQEEIVSTDIEESSSSVREVSKEERDNLIMTVPNEDIPEFAIVDDLNEPINIEETANEVIIETEDVESLFDENLENQDILMEVDAEFEDTKRLLCNDEMDVDNENIQSAPSLMADEEVDSVHVTEKNLSKLSETDQLKSKQAAEITQTTEELIAIKEPTLELDKTVAEHSSSVNSTLPDTALLPEETVLVEEISTCIESNDKKASDIELNSQTSDSSLINRNVFPDERPTKVPEVINENNDSVLLKETEAKIVQSDPISESSKTSLCETSLSIPATSTITADDESIGETTKKHSEENVHISEFNKLDNVSGTCKNDSSLEQLKNKCDEEHSKKYSDEKEVLETIEKDKEKTDADSEVRGKHSSRVEEVIESTPVETSVAQVISTSGSVDVDSKVVQPIEDTISSDSNFDHGEQIRQMEVISAVEAISEVEVNEQDTLGIEQMVKVSEKDDLNSMEDVFAIESITECKEVEEIDLVDSYELEVIEQPLKKDDVDVSEAIQIEESIVEDKELQQETEIPSLPMDTSKQVVSSSTELEVAVVEEQNPSIILSRQPKTCVHSYEDAVKETSSNESWKTVVTFDEDKGISEEVKHMVGKEDIKDNCMLEVKEDSIDKLEYLSPTSCSELQSADDQMLVESPSIVTAKDTASNLTARSNVDKANIEVIQDTTDLKEEIVFEETVDNNKAKENEKSRSEDSFISDEDKVNPVNVECSNTIENKEMYKKEDIPEKVECNPSNKEDVETDIVFGGADVVQEMEDDMEASICVQETDNEVVIESEEIGFLFDKINTNEDVHMEGDTAVDGNSLNEKMVEDDDCQSKEENVIVEKIFDSGLLIESENIASDSNILDIVDEDTLEKTDKPETETVQAISEDIIDDEKIKSEIVEEKDSLVSDVNNSEAPSISNVKSTEHDNLVPLLKTVTSCKIPVSDIEKHGEKEQKEQKVTNFQPTLMTTAAGDQPGQKLEPITLRIYKDNLSIRTDDLDSPKKHRSPTLAAELKSQLSPQVKGSPTRSSSPQTKQLEFTLKIAKDANTNFPKATMSPKSNLSPSGLVWKSDMSPCSSVNKESHSPGQASPPTSESTLNKLKLKICKPNENVELSKQQSNSGTVLETKSSPLRCTDSSVGETSEQTSSKLTEEFRTPKSHLKLETMFKKMLESQKESKPNIIGGDMVSSSPVKDVVETAAAVPTSEKLSEPLVTVSVPPVIPTPRKRGRPRKIVTLPLELPMSTADGDMQQSFSAPDSASADNINRPMRSCRGRTKPIVVRTRKPRGGGVMRGGARGRGITRITPDRETLTEYEKAELAKIEAKKERLRAESIARYEAKKAKKLAKKLKDEERRKRLAREKAEKAEAAAPQVFEEETRMSAPDSSRGHTPYRSNNHTALASMRRDGSKIEPREQALEAVASWNANLNRERKEERRCALDLQTFTIHYPKTDRNNMTRPVPKVGLYPIALIPGQYCDYYKQYTPTELMYFPMNTVVYGPLKPNERQKAGASDDGSGSDTDTSSSDDSSESSSDSSDSSEEQDDSRKCCKICKTSKKPKDSGTSLLESSLIHCAHCKSYYHASCQDFAEEMLPHIRKYDWSCIDCKKCLTCKSRGNVDKILCCDLCDRGHHVECLGLKKVPERWHCNVCAYCTNCGSREPGAPDWQHEYKKGDKGIKVYVRTLCATCSKMPNLII